MIILNITIEPSFNNRWKQRQRPTAEHWTPKVQLKSGRSENMSKEVKTMMGTATLEQLPELMGVHHLQLDRDGTSSGLD